jgi:cytochrome bd-type quinol oxidase subunit 2
MSIRGNGRVFTQDSWFSYDSPVSVILLVIMVLFFFVLGATYLNMRSTDTSIASHSGMLFVEIIYLNLLFLIQYKACIGYL